MGYVIDSAEKTQKSATEQETKTMLYLMGYMDDSKKIESFIIDAFNDVTAVDEDKTIYWDSQSKGDASSSPAAIGKELVTLFKNYISIFQFDYYILSLRKIAEKNIVESKRPLSNICVLKFEDFTTKAQQEIIDNLKEECNAKTYINVDENIDKNIKSFLEIVKIVINNDSNGEYVKKITFMKDDLINDVVINDIFETIRKEQVAIKTRNHINGIELNKREDAFALNRTIHVKSINSLILARIIGHDIISKNSVGLFIPTLFNDYIVKNGLTTEEIDGEVNDAINGIYSMLINENLNKDFWNLIYAILEECEKENKVYDVYNNILVNHSNILYLRSAKENELIYLIACILGGKRNED